jgi:hypothetical protein
MADQYEIRYTQEAVEDLRPLRAFDQTRILDAISRHLASEPALVTMRRSSFRCSGFF